MLDPIRSRTRLAAAAALVMAHAGLAGQPSSAQEPPLKLSAHVFVVPQGKPGAQSNIGIVVGTKAALIVDSGLGPRNGAIIANQVHALAKDLRWYVAATHFHPEHMMGESGFPATTIVVRSKAQQRDVDVSGPTIVEFFRKRSPADMEGAVFRPADILLEGDTDIDLGGTRVKILSLGPTHTAGDIGFFVEGDAVVFTGDVAMDTPLGINPGSTFTSAPTIARTWLASLERLVALRPTRVVPAHGPLGDIQVIDKHRRFMSTVRDRVQALKAQGKSADETAAAVKSELAATYPTPATSTVVPDAARLFYREIIAAP